MKDITLIILCAGESSRFGLKTKKQWLRTADEPLWLNVTNRLSSYASFAKTIVVGHQNELSLMENFTDDFEFVAGGSTRQESIKNALQKVTTPYVMISDVARSCIPKEVFIRLIEAKQDGSCIVPMLQVSDTVVFETNTIEREHVKLIQTPQLSNTQVLTKALQTQQEFTDESSAIKALGEKIKYIEGSTKSQKLTFCEDIQAIECLQAPLQDCFTGFGVDIHQFEEGKPMVLGGVAIENGFGFKAHSDGDVLIHSVIDSLLGACGAGDIGEFFPDNDQAYKDADSKKLLEHIVKFVHSVGYEIVNIDLTILIQIPKINPYKKAIKSSLSQILQIGKNKINIKATTAEKMGFIGRKEGASVYSVATLKYYDWTRK